MMRVIKATNSRELVNQCNDKEIKKEDVVGIYTLHDVIYLIYFK